MELEERKVALPQVISKTLSSQDAIAVDSKDHKRKSQERMWRKCKVLFGIFFPEISDAQNKVCMIVWISIYIISLTVFVIQFTPLLKKYFSFGVSVAVTIEHSTKLKFPQITICPASIFEKSKIRGVTKSNLYQLAMLDDVQKEYMLKYIATKDGATISDLDCPESMILCINTTQCIPEIWICDGINDCEDESDEDEEIYMCSSRTTDEPSACIGAKYKPCKNNPEMCAVYCDDREECDDGSDEMLCTVAFPQVNLTASLSKEELKSHSGYPMHNYPDNTKTVTKIDQFSENVPNILIEFKDFNVENDYECLDYIEVLDADESKPGNWENSKYCGSTAPATTILKAPVTITFYTDNDWNEKGYALTYKATSEDPSAERKKRTAEYGDAYDYFEEFASEDYADTYGVDIKKDLNIIKGISGEDWRSVYYKLRQLTPPEFTIAQLFAVFPPEIPYSYGVSLEDLVIDCAYGSTKCNSTHSNFQTLMNSKYGKCFMFNSNKQNNSKRVSTRSGINNGVVLTLFLNDDESIGLLTQDSGISVTINPSKIYPLPHQNSIVVKPGTSTVISIKQKSIRRLNRKDNQCTNVQKNWVQHKQIREAYESGEISDRVFEELKNGTSTFDDPYHTWSGYNQQVCYETCLYENLKMSCKCVDSYLYTYQGDDELPKSPYPVCSPWNSTQIVCKQNVYTKFRNQQKLDISCDCPNSCEDTLYEITSSTSRFPSKNYLYYFLEQVRKSRGEEARGFVKNLLKRRASGKINDEETLAKAQKNFLRLEIYFEELNYEFIEESPAYSFAELLAAFAGNIGMFVGWSVLTFSHILIFLFNLCFHCFNS